MRPIQLRDLPLHQWGNLPVKDPTQQVCKERQNVLNAVGVGETLEDTVHDAQVHSYVVDVFNFIVHQLSFLFDTVRARGFFTLDYFRASVFFIPRGGHENEAIAVRFDRHDRRQKVTAFSFLL